MTNKRSRDELLNQLTASLQDAQALKLDRLAFVLSVAIAEERFRDQNAETDSADMPSFDMSRNVIMLPSRNVAAREGEYSALDPDYPRQSIMTMSANFYKRG